MNPIFTGCATALVTPFTETGVNYDALGKLIDFQIENHVDALVICGSTGEPATMTDDEHVNVMKYAIEHVAGRVPVIAGTASNDTAYAVKISKEACSFGADALLIAAPYYNKPTQKGLYMHYAAIAEAVDIPIILYNIPGRTGCNLLPKTVQKLAEFDNIVGIKEASGDLSHVAKIAHLMQGKDFSIYSGNDDQVLPVLSLGGKGVISVLSNICPQDTHDMVHSYLNGNTQRATELQLNMLDLINALFVETNPIPVKTALNILGFNTGNLRLPLCEMEEANLQILKNAMKDYGLI